MGVSPKLYVNKPKKAQLKQHQQQQPSSPPPPAPPSSSSSMASSASARSAAPPPQPPKESFVRRYKYLWPMLLAVNFSIGAICCRSFRFSLLELCRFYLRGASSTFAICVAYLFMRTKKKDVGTEEGEMPYVPTAASTAASTAVGEKENEVTKEVATPPPVLPVIVHEPIPENQQRELFKWMLEEKRRVKPKDHEEKRRIDEEKAILKHFIRAKSIPVL